MPLPKLKGYRILRRQPESGLYEAVSVGRGTAVVVKLVRLPADVVERHARLRAFRKLQTLRHPHVVTHYDVQLIAPHEAALVMEPLEGPSLAQWLQQHGPAPQGAAIRWTLEAAQGLAAVHEAGLLHRDLKPENLLLVPGRGVQVTDFGLAIPCDELFEPTPGRLTGTAAYLAPELAEGTGGWSCQSDLYALGCVLFELLTGRPPFEGGSELETLYLHATAPAPCPPGAPAGLRRILERLLAKRPERRYSTANQLVAALRALG